MADVNVRPPDGRRLREADRGQLLIVAGLVMAVSLVALVVLLNATIYSENLATRGVEGTDREAADVRANVVGNVEELIDATNRAEPTVAASDLVDDVDALERRMSRSHAERGATIHLDTDESRVTSGTYVTTDGNATSLANETDATGYTFAGGIDRTRGFTLDLDRIENMTAASATDEAFHVAFHGSALSESQEIYVYRNVTTEEVVVANATGGGEPTVRCSIAAAPDDEIRLDLTGERIEGTACIGVWPTALLAPSDSYTIDFENADAANGTATATVRSQGTGTDPDADHAGVSPAVYDATIDLRYRTADFRFETSVRVAPGEPHA